MLVSLFLVIALAAAPSHAADWPEWRGPNGDSVSPETGLLKSWPADGPKLLWTATGLGKGFSTVSISDGLLYTSGSPAEQTFIFAFDLDGKLKWKSPNGTPWKPSPEEGYARDNGGARATPTVNDGLVYQLNELGRLAAFDAKTGAEKWAIDIIKEFEAEPPKWAYAESVLIDGDRLICYPGGKKGYMVALDKKTGKTVWANTDIGQAASYCSAILVEGNPLRQLITTTADGLIGVDADTGKHLWSFPHTNMRKINVMNPIYHDGRVYISNGYGGGGVAVDLAVVGKTVTAKKAWANIEPDNHHGGMVLLDGSLYGYGHNKSGWACLDFKTGETRFRDRDAGKGSVFYADGMFYCYDEKGTMQLVEPSTKEFKVVSKFTVPKGGVGFYWAHPVVCGGRLYIRHADHLYCYDVRAK